MKIKEVIDNLTNGNLTDAKKGAKKYPLQAIIDHEIWNGNNYNNSLMIAYYLKGMIPFQEYCDNLKSN
jgi:hypothetical protein